MDEKTNQNNRRVKADPEDTVARAEAIAQARRNGTKNNAPICYSCCSNEHMVKGKVSLGQKFYFEDVPHIAIPYRCSQCAIIVLTSHARNLTGLVGTLSADLQRIVDSSRSASQSMRRNLSRLGLLMEEEGVQSE